jgi:hypothetical protein
MNNCHSLETFNTATVQKAQTWEYVYLQMHGNSQKFQLKKISLSSL